MPKKTFFNLSEDKQNQIINQSIKEFSKSTYNEVKISAITKSAGIPRSSFYDYFEDKMDLYKYIISMIGDKKAKYMEERKSEPNFFDELKSNLLSGARFIAFEPELDAIAKYFLSDKKLVEEIYGVDSMNIVDVFKEMLFKGIESGELREDIDVDFTARTLNLISAGLMVEGAGDKNKTLEQVIVEMADHMVDFVRNGIGKV